MSDRRFMDGKGTHVGYDAIERILTRLDRLCSADMAMASSVSDVMNIANETKHALARLSRAAREMETYADSCIDAGATQLEGDFDALELDRYSRFNELCRDVSECSRDLESLQAHLARECEDMASPTARRALEQRQLRRSLMRLQQVDLPTEIGHVLGQLEIEGLEVDLVMDGNRSLALDHQFVSQLAALVGQLVSSHVVPVKMGVARSRQVRIDLRRRAAKIGVLVQGPVPDTDEPELEDWDVAGDCVVEVGSAASGCRAAVGRVSGVDDRLVELVASLGGTLLVRRDPQQGVVSELELPMRNVDESVLFVAVAGRVFGLLMTQIISVVRMADAAVCDDGIVVGGRTCQLVSLGELTASDKPGSPGSDWGYAVLLRDGDHVLAVGIERLIQDRRMRLVPLSQPLSPSMGLVAGAMLEGMRGDDEIVLVLEASALIRGWRERKDSAVTDAVGSVQRCSAVVLVVDDSVTIRKVSERLLSRHGYQVASARDGRDALDVLQTVRPDVILLDIEMPRMDGFQFAETVKRDPSLRDLPIIMISSRCGEKHRRQAADLGIEDFLGKPFSEAELIATIERLLRSEQ